MIQKELTHYLNQLLEINNISDYCPNGLQVQGKENIKTIITGVTASEALIQKAIEKKADAVLVHHGYFWKNESPVITDIKYKRLKLLLENNINLFAYHLPLDTHPVYGNNVQLAKLLDFKIIQSIEINNIKNLAILGKLPQAININQFSDFLETKLNRKPLIISSDPEQLIQKIVWCTGAAQNYIHLALEYNADAYLTGEISESTTHFAREAGIHFISAGHHATERYGIRALGEHLSEKFGLQHEFVDIDNPV